jgi:hypothetical protein
MNRIEYLESLLPKDNDVEKKHWRSFEKYSQYLGNGVYEWRGINATDTRELFLMGCLHIEKIKYKTV